MGLMKQEDWAPARWIAMESVSPKDVVYPGFQLAGNKVDYLEKEARMPQFRKPFQVETKKYNRLRFSSPGWDISN